jgi:ligand-binding SRPBCC domain-containing protein
MKLINTDTGELTDGKIVTNDQLWTMVREITDPLTDAEKVDLVPQLEVVAAARRARWAAYHAEADALYDLFQFLTIWQSAFRHSNDDEAK